MAKKEQESRLSDLRKALNKGSLTTVHDLTKSNPADVKKWISTGSTWLDMAIASPSSLRASGAKKGGIPVGKITELAGLEATGKSFLAWVIAANAQKEHGMEVVFFDSEGATDRSFIERLGVDFNKLHYMSAGTVENVMENIENAMKATEAPILFIWDSLGMTPSVKEAEGSYDPQSQVAVKARVLSLAMSKLTDSLCQHGSTFLIVNQLMTNIDLSNPFTEPYVTPGGKKVKFAYSLRLWLTGRKAKKWKIENENGDRIGADVKVDIKKSRFGSEGRVCNFKIMWGPEFAGVADKESWLDAVKFSPHFTPGAWHKLVMEDGSEVKFQGVDWMKKLEDPKFKKRILQLMSEALIR